MEKIVFRIKKPLPKAKEAMLADVKEELLFELPKALIRF